MLYRAQDKAGVSRLGYADSTDGIHFTRRADPALSPEADYEKNGGIEDPRLVRIGSTYYLTYTGYNKQEAQLCLATSKDLVRWERQGVIMPANRGRWNVGWTKAGSILTQKVNGKYWMYYMADPAKDVNEMGVAYSEDLIHWTEALDQPVLKRRPGLFDAKVVEPGPPPIMTEQGILLIYNGANEKTVYATGWVLFDKRDPTKVIERSDQPIFSVEREWEKEGQVPNVVFVEGMVRDRARWLFYYGGADKYVGVAVAESLLSLKSPAKPSRR
jgi:beta-1,2-mannosidase